MTRHIRWQILLILLGVVLVGILLAYLAINYTTVLRPGYGQPGGPTGSLHVAQATTPREASGHE